MSKNFGILFALYFLLLNPVAAESDWRSNLDQSCRLTLTARAKNITSKDGIWFDTKVSMAVWADLMKLEKPEELCPLDHPISADRAGYMHCMASYKSMWDWYARCKPVVDAMRRIERQ